MRKESEMHDLVIVICTINRAQFLQQCLLCLTRQIWDNVQIIIVDDGSTDGTETLCDFYKGKIDIQYIKRKKNNYSSPAAARNTGWRAANAKYISFTDPEVILRPNTVRRCYEYHLGHPKSITALKPIMMTEKETQRFFDIDEHCQQDRFTWLYEKDIEEFKHAENAQIQQRKTWRDNHFSMMPKQALIDADGVNENFTSWGFEGIDLVERILDKGYRLYNFDNEFVYHLWHDAPRDMTLADAQRKQFGIKNCGKHS